MSFHGLLHYNFEINKNSVFSKCTFAGLRDSCIRISAPYLVTEIDSCLFIDDSVSDACGGAIYAIGSHSIISISNCVGLGCYTCPYNQLAEGQFAYIMCGNSEIKVTKVCVASCAPFIIQSDKFQRAPFYYGSGIKSVKNVNNSRNFADVYIYLIYPKESEDVEHKYITVERSISCNSISGFQSGTYCLRYFNFIKNDSNSSDLIWQFFQSSHVTFISCAFDSERMIRSTITASTTVKMTNCYTCNLNTSLFQVEEIRDSFETIEHPSLGALFEEMGIFKRISLQEKKKLMTLNMFFLFSIVSSKLF